MISGGMCLQPPACVVASPCPLVKSVRVADALVVDMAFLSQGTIASLAPSPRRCWRQECGTWLWQRHAKSHALPIDHARANSDQISAMHARVLNVPKATGPESSPASSQPTLWHVVGILRLSSLMSGSSFTLLGFQVIGLSHVSRSKAVLTMTNFVPAPENTKSTPPRFDDQEQQKTNIARRWDSLSCERSGKSTTSTSLTDKIFLMLSSKTDSYSNRHNIQRATHFSPTSCSSLPATHGYH